MLIKILSRQIPEYQDVINEGLREALPEHQLGMQAEIYKQLLCEEAECWVSQIDGHFEGIGITRVIEDVMLGGKMLEVVCIYGPNGAEHSRTIHDGIVTMLKFGESRGCDRLSFYTNNPEVIKYLDVYDKIWKTTYYQIKLEEV